MYIWWCYDKVLNFIIQNRLEWLISTKIVLILSLFLQSRAAVGYFGFVEIFLWYAFEVKICSICGIILLRLLSVFLLAFLFCSLYSLLCIFDSLLSCAVLLANLVSPLHCK